VKYINVVYLTSKRDQLLAQTRTKSIIRHWRPGRGHWPGTLWQG